jgi:DNA adenine methylase
MKPFLKWVGGKGRVIAQLEQLFPGEYKNYFEPFVGGGAVFFDVKAKNSTINDINRSLIGAYINIRDNIDRLVKQLDDLQSIYYELSEIQQTEMFYNLREEYNNLSDKNSVRKSALLIFLNKTCFNGMYRENKKGGFNVPFGKHRKPTICDEVNLREISEQLKYTNILAGSYRDAVIKAKAGDFIYFDPPYHPLNPTSSFTSYSEDDFIEKDQIELKELIDEFLAFTSKKTAPPPTNGSK